MLLCFKKRIINKRPTQKHQPGQRGPGWRRGAECFIQPGELLCTWIIEEPRKHVPSLSLLRGTSGGRRSDFTERCSERDSPGENLHLGLSVHEPPLQSHSLDIGYNWCFCLKTVIDSCLPPSRVLVRSGKECLAEPRP